MFDGKETEWSQAWEMAVCHWNEWNKLLGGKSPHRAESTRTNLPMNEMTEGSNNNRRWWYCCLFVLKLRRYVIGGYMTDKDNNLLGAYVEHLVADSRLVAVVKGVEMVIQFILKESVGKMEERPLLVWCTGACGVSREWKTRYKPKCRTFVNIIEVEFVTLE
ncbi:hypothetical protein PIB30_028560 [Stylosanthes scabra]|uniref:Uncharacterized protein n=1 Tax=Stylosanthes scabra TaxID=79078 RepID=A0ABU6TBS4_9FABA|nr:hypothetical protein [Stylosanthes scabra]